MLRGLAGAAARTYRARRGAGVIGTAIAMSAALVLAGCGAAESKGGSGSGSGTTDNAQLAAAQKTLEEARTAATRIPLTTPLPKKPEPGKTVVLLKCDAISCVNFDKGMRDAAALVGWRISSLPYKSADPSTLLTAMDTALRLKPSAVVVPGPDPSLWAPMLKKYEAAKIPIITIVTPNPPAMSSPIVSTAGEKYLSRQGQVVGDWFVVDSKGKGNALILTIPAFPVFTTISKAMEQAIKANCGGCSAKVLPLTIPQLANQQIPSTVVAKLRQDPTITHVVAMSGTFLIGLPTALKAAGLQGKVHVGGALAREDNIGELHNGNLAMVTNQSEFVSSYLVMDAAYRLAQGARLETDAYETGPAVQIYDKATIGAVRASVDTPVDYADQFKKLWLAGKG